MIHRISRYSLLLVLAASVATASQGQDPTAVPAPVVKVGGLAYLDYFYIFQSPGDDKDFNGFQYRRLYLTSDFTLSEAFSGRARLEATNGTLNGALPMPFVKDLYLRWISQSGHRITFGLMPPPVYATSEDLWNFRALEKTIMDLFGIISSRDFGVLVDGPLVTNRLSYLFMVGNNNSTRVEQDKYKRVYGQLRLTPSDHVTITAGGNYAAYGDERDSGVTLYGFAGYCLVDCGASSDRFRIGAEGYWQQFDYEGNASLASYGLSGWAWYYFNPQWGVVVRTDVGTAERFANEAARVADASTTFILGGLIFQPHAQVRITPNLYYIKAELDDDPELQGRLTVDFVF